MLKRLNDALPGLVLGILIYGVVVELIGLCYAADKLRFTSGLVVGLVLAVAMAVNIAAVIRDAVENRSGDQEHAGTQIIAKSVLRFVVVAAVFIAMIKLNLGDLFAAFLGVLGLKISAYLQPLTHKIIAKLNDPNKK